MKAERRHELKTNSLSQGLENAPAFFQQFGSRILLGVILCLLTYILVRNHYRDKEDKAANAAKALGGALYTLNEMRNMPTHNSQGSMLAPEQIADMRKNDARDIEASLKEVIDTSEDPKILAQAWVVRGDLDWELANFPALPGSSTRPAELNPAKSVEEYLTDAADAYNKVLQSPLNADHPSVTAARFSLAKIAENRGQWDKAKEFYQQVADDASAGKDFQQWAKTSLDELKILEKPAFVGGVSSEGPIKAPTNFGPDLPSSLTPSTSSLLPPTTQPAASSQPATTATTATPTTQPVHP